MRRNVLDGGIERRALAHRPAPQHAVVLQAEVVVQAGAVRLVLLHDEDRRVLGRTGLAGGGFGRDAEVALGAVGRDGGVARGGLSCLAGGASHACGLGYGGEGTRTKRRGKGCADIEHFHPGRNRRTGVIARRGAPKQSPA